MGEIVPGWSGTVKKEDIVPLAEAIRKQFDRKTFLIAARSRGVEHNLGMYPSSYFDEPRRITEEIEARPDSPTIPHIWLIAINNFCIYVGDFVCLSQKALLVEKTIEERTWSLILHE